jgi:phosphoribosylformylglycinamidine synthase
VHFLAVTDNLNFGNPEKPEVMGQLVRAIAGLGEACRALDFPIVSGNVSLYNETNGEAILPTPTIGGVGLIDDWRKSATLAFKAVGEAILLAGAPPTWGMHLGQSLFCAKRSARKAALPRPSTWHKRSVSAISSAR